MYAFLPEASVPSTESLQSSITELEFDLEVDPGCVVAESRGYVQCVIDGQLSGCEIHFQEQNPNQSEYAFVPKSHSCCILLRWDGELLESIVAMIVSTALASRHEAIVSYAGGNPIPAEELLSGTTAMISALG